MRFFLFLVAALSAAFGLFNLLVANTA